MLVLLGVVFLVLPLVELYVIVQVAQGIGVLQTIGLLVLVSVVGAWLVKREGAEVVRRLQRSVREGHLPHREVVDGFLVLLAGALLCSPGFVTDVLGVVLLVPPSRAVVRTLVLRGLAGRVAVVGAGPGPRWPGGGPRPPRGAGPSIDTTGSEAR